MKKILLILFLLLFLGGIAYLFNSYYHNEYYAIRLTKAISDNNLSRLKQLLDERSNINSKTHVICIDCTDDVPALHMAAFLGNYEAVKILVEYGADVNNTNATNDLNPLTAALSSNTENSLIIAKFLIENGADFNYKPSNGTGKNALATTIFYSHLDSLDKQQEKFDFIKWLIEKGGDVENAGGYGNLIFYTAESNNLFVLEYLLNNEFATIDLQNDAGYTALMFASRSGANEVVEYLLNNGVNKKLLNKYGQTALDIAIENKNDEIISLLNE